MQGTRVSFHSKDDAIHFAEKQGESIHEHILSSVLKTVRMGLLCPTRTIQKDTTEELLRELCLQAQQAPNPSYKVTKCTH